MGGCVATNYPNQRKLQARQRYKGDPTLALLDEIEIGEEKFH